MKGTTSAERRQRLPGDELVASPTIVTEHAIDVITEPISVMAVTVAGTAEKVTSILPSDECRVACWDDTS